MTERFDFIVIGAGSAGCVLAGRLSEDPSRRVLLVEAGPLERPAHSFDPVLWPTEIGGVADWAYQTVPQPGLGGRSSVEPHGKMVGGSSSLNGMMYTRGDPTDYDAWAHGGAPGWGYEALGPYFERLEGMADRVDGYGRAGAMYLQHRSAHDVHAAAKDFLAAAEALGHPRVASFDTAKGMLGAGCFAVNVKDGRRFGAREAYLEPALGRPNLELWPDSRAVALRFEGGRCRGVVVARGGQEVEARATGEVILAASTAESPKLLMLAGIGPAAHLASHGIAVRVDLPGVGANLHDHVMGVVRFTLARAIPNPAFAWEVGIFSQSQPGWLGPDLETIFNPTAFDRQDEGPPTGLTMVNALLRPMSRGTVRLASADPFEAPVLDPQFLAVDSDARRLGQAVRLALRLARTEPMARWIGDLGDNDGLSFDVDDDALLAWVRRNAVSQYHMAGTCKMGSDQLSVVDPELRVFGVEGLRVVDASILPRVVSGHCQAAVMAMAERASDLIGRDHALARRPAPTAEHRPRPA